ncbi:glycerophosphodiester phosphodiesterase [Agreia sp. PsM10]|uniref:glycerophosphodiester phosphodiesterase n=1 Tax=Agreia sp. PsM10 TaxID=3030533 RepID=UPI00263B23DE|nr:glycerophosphodiester phosphodiesterase [Agreia sp. PsM10]MDN4639550.1 glycerophosphodiester phosphodiesterase [Agreia sp. PsM10]
MLAHRGLALDAPENTLAAFDAALRRGAIYIETDVHASRDGVAMIAHDPSLLRVAGIDAEVANMTTDELQKVDLGDGHRMPTLLDALRAFPQARFNIDVKSQRAGVAIARAVIEAGATGRVLVTSFSASRRAVALDLLPGVANSASAPRFVAILALAKLGVLGLAPWVVGGVDAVQVPPRRGRLSIATPRVVRALHRRGVEMHVWTINDPDEIRRLLAMGVDGIVTDRCDLALDVVRSTAEDRSPVPPA